MTTLINKLVKVRDELILVINDFPQEKRNEVLFDKWSLKDILAHLSGWNKLTVTVLNNLKKSKTSQWGRTVKEINLDSTSTRKDKNWSEIYNEFVTSSQKLIDSYSSLPDDLWDKTLYEGKKFTATKFLKIDISHHLEHLDQIKKHPNYEKPMETC